MEHNEAIASMSAESVVSVTYHTPAYMDEYAVRMENA